MAGSSVFDADCILCEKNMGILNGKVILKDGYVCTNCWNKTGLNNRINPFTESREYNVQQIKGIVKTIESNKTIAKKFNANGYSSDLIKLDDVSQMLLIKSTVVFGDIDLIHYDQIVGFELIEDGETITKGGFATAAIGGLIDGTGGAIVGSILGKKKTKSICTSLQLKITIRDYYQKSIFVKYIESSTKKDSSRYKNAYNQVQSDMSALQVAMEKSQRSAGVTASKSLNSSVADEIVKLKSLLDQGIITGVEFKQAKNKLLGI